jgi:hypothetical protein
MQPRSSQGTIIFQEETNIRQSSSSNITMSSSSNNMIVKKGDSRSPRYDYEFTYDSSVVVVSETKKATAAILFVVGILPCLATLTQTSPPIAHLANQRCS